MAAIKSKRTKRFKEQLAALPSEIQDLAKFAGRLYGQKSHKRQRLVEKVKEELKVQEN